MNRLDSENRPNPIASLRDTANSIINGVRIEIKTPSSDKKIREGMRNRCVGQIVNEMLLNNFGPNHIDNDGPIDNFIKLEAKLFVDIGLIDMAYTYQTIKKEPVPNNSDEFFETIKKAPEWKLRQQNVTLPQIENARQIINTERQKSEIDLSPLWFFTELLSLLFVAGNIKGRSFYEDANVFLRKKTGLNTPARVGVPIGISVSLSQMVNAYVSPQTCSSLIDVAKKINKPSST